MKTEAFVYQNDEELIKKLSSLPTDKEILLQVFSGELNKNKLEYLLNLINKHTSAKVIGATTDGEIIGDEILQRSIVISYCVFEKSRVKVVLLEKDKTSYDIGKKLGNMAESAKAAIIFADGLNINGEEFLRGFKEKSSCVVVGGLAGDNSLFKETFVFDNNKIINKGVVCAFLEGDIEVINNFEFDWYGVGKKMKITKAYKGIVYEIDGKKPIDVYRYYFGDAANDILKVGIEFPLIVKRNGINVARAVIKAYEDGSLMFAGNLKEGEEVQFSFGEVDAILDNSQKIAKSFTKNIPEVIFIYSCMARKKLLEEAIKLEIAPFNKIASVSGFFTYGEFCDNLFFNESMTILGLREEKIEKKIEFGEIKYDESLFMKKAFSHLMRVTSEELCKLNENLEREVLNKTKEIIEKNKKLEYLLRFDTLTGLYNRFSLDEDLPYIKSLMFLDIKNFSKINDLYGEEVGDGLLIEFANVLRKFCTNKMYRIGADQFVIASFDGNFNFKDLYKKLEDYFKDNLFYIKWEDSVLEFKVYFRAGIVKGCARDSANIKIRADLLLRYMKENGYDYYECSEELNLRGKLKKEVEIIKMVEDAIENDLVVPVFQKIQKEKEYYYETLIRIKDGENLISPFVFLDIIKLTDYYFELTRIVIEKAFKIFSKRKEKISVNLSYMDIRNDDLVEFIKKKIKEYKMEGKLIFEILEQESMDNFEVVRNFILEMRKYNVKIAIDDFGSGYSNFYYLTEIKPDIIKIDGSLIKEIDKNTELYIIAKHINAFAKEIGCETIAEFVVNESIFKKVKEIGVDGVQGYFIDKPKVIL